MTKSFFKYLLFAGLVTVLTSACASSRGFNRGALRESMEGKPVVTDTEIAKTLALKAQLPRPFRLAVLFAEPATAYRGSSAKWRWTEEEKANFLKLADSLKTSGEVSDVAVLNGDVLLGAASLRETRLAAARQGADALLVVTGVKDVDSYANDWAWTYLALAPMLFVPGTQTDVLVLARASLWDVRNEFLYMSAEGEAVEKSTKPLMLANDQALTEKAKTQAVAKLSDEIQTQIKGLKSLPANAPEAPRKTKARTKKI